MWTYIINAWGGIRTHNLRVERSATGTGKFTNVQHEIKISKLDIDYLKFVYSESDCRPHAMLFYNMKYKCFPNSYFAISYTSLALMFIN
jgi:hypothetical protein